LYSRTRAPAHLAPARFIEGIDSASPRIQRVMHPIACSLSGRELADQRETLLLGLADHAVERTALPSGMRLRFPATAERMRQIDAVVRREHECCPFLEFRVGLALGGSSLTLDVTGPEGTADLLAELLEQSIAA
jgi:hypothetical protein